MTSLFLLLLALLLGLWPLASPAQVTVSGAGVPKIVPNDPTTGTILNGLAKVGSTGAIRTTTTDTNVPIWIVTGGQGTNPNVPAVLAISGDVPCIMDATASNVRGQFVVQSATQNNQCHATATAPSTGYAAGFMADNATTAGQTALVSAQLVNFQPGSGTGTGSVTSVNLAAPTGFTSSGGPVTASGTLTLGLATETAHFAWLGPLTGSPAVPTWRALDLTDLPAGVMTSCAGDLAGTAPNCTVAQASGAFALPGDVTPTALSGDVNDYAGCAGTTICRLNGGAADRLITGLAGGADGRVLSLCNIGTTNKLTLVDQSTSSSTANRFLAGANLTLRPNVCKPVWYDSTSSRWRPWDSGVLDPYGVRTCTIPFGSMSAAASPLPDDDDFPNGCTNNSGFDWRITGVKVFANAGTPSFNPILTGGSATSILTTACTATAGTWTACSLNATPPIVHSFSGTGSATCSSTPCSIDGLISIAGGVATYAFIEITGVLQ